MLEFFVAFIFTGICLVALTAFTMVVTIALVMDKVFNKEVWRHLYKKTIERRMKNDEMYN